MTNLSGKTLFITGASRGIGRAIALRAAHDGANIVVAAKTAELDPRLPGTIYTTAAEIEAAGGKALPVVVDVRSEEQVYAAVDKAVAQFGHIDILINNASAISLTDTLTTPLKRYDLMMDINVRGTFVCSQACIPHLKQVPNPHILTLSPPLDVQPKWFGPHVAYTTSKFGMSMLALGLAEEFRADGIAVNALWPRTLIATSALKIAAPINGTERGRRPAIMADAAYLILTQDARAPHQTGNFYLDEEVLRSHGVMDFSQYSVTPGVEPEIDMFVD
jgi:citronellol/citronellal dehydrogenase